MKVKPSSIGDYSSNIAFLLSKELKLAPSQISQSICEHIQPDIDLKESILKSAKSTGKGFITLDLSEEWLSMQVLYKPSLEVKNSSTQTTCIQEGHVRKIILDYGSPNMSKEFHVGHIRTIMIGDCLQRILRYQGHEVESVSHVGDFGTPIGYVIAEALSQKLPWATTFVEGKDVLERTLYPTPSELSRLYVQAKSHAKQDEEFAKASSAIVLDIQKGEPGNPYKKIWNVLCQASRVGFDDVYNRLHVGIPEKGESFYAPMIPDTLQELKDKGLIVQSEGALVIHSDRWEAPLIVEKADRSWLYATTDLAAIRHRLVDRKFDTLLYLVDASQQQHFSQVFEVAEKANWIQSDKTRIEHVQFGVVQGANGQKLSSRDGTPLTLKALLDESVEETRKALVTARSMIISDRQTQDVQPLSLDEKLSSPERGDEKSLEELDLIESNAPIIAYNAIKYFELSQARTQNYVFSFQAMLNFRGNTSFYILYAYARIRTMLKKARQQGANIPNLSANEHDMKPYPMETKERELAIKILQYPDMIRQVEDSLCPHYLSAHAFQTAQKFHSFYEGCRVLGSEHQAFRIQLCLATENMLSKTLNLLNVQVVDHI